MESQRLILFVALALVLFLLWDAWQKQFNPPPPPPATTAQTTKPAATTADIPESADIPRQADAKAAPIPGSSAALQQGQKVIVETDYLRAVIDTHGGDLRQVDLLTYPVSTEKPDEPYRLFDDTPANLFIAQSGFASKIQRDDGTLVVAPNHKTTYQASRNRYTLQDGENEVVVDLNWTSPQGVQFTKRYRFSRSSHLIVIDHIIKNAADKPWRGNLYQQFQRSEVKSSGGIGSTYTYTGGVIWSPDDKYQKIKFGDMRDEDLKRNIKGGWAAMIQHYFLGAWIPPADKAYTYYTRTLPNDRFLLGMKASEEAQVAPGTTQVESNQLYVGPKLQHVLAKIAPGLDLTVDYGVLTIIAKPIYWLLEKIHAIVGNWGWSIILLTLLIKLAFYKLSETSYKSMAKMRKLTPRLKAMKERYGDDKQKMHQAQMELFRKEKINPLGGCLPILVQIPVFIALYWVLLESVELRQAPWILWINDLSVKDPYFVLPVIMGISMLVQQKLNPTPMDPIQAKVMMALPIVFTFFFLFFPAGLVLYWVVNNTLSIIQQWYITRVVVKAD